MRQQHLVGMLLGRPVADDLERLGVDDGHLGLAPEADIELLARLVERQAVGIAVGLERDLALKRTRLGVEPAQRMAERGGDIERLAVLGERQAGRHALVFLGRLASADSAGQESLRSGYSKTVFFESSPSAWSKR